MGTASRPSLFTLRVAPSPWARRAIGAGALGVMVVVWWILTAGASAETRIISPVILPSPIEVIRSFPSLWGERALLASVAATLQRVLTGFALAIVIGVPLGILAGSYRVVDAAAAPIALFGRNIPIAALI